MKKETVATFLDKLERQAKRVQNEVLRQAQVNAINQCRNWLLSITWADMLVPVNGMLKAITDEAQPLIERERQKQAMNEQEQKRLQGMRDIYAIYYQFYQKIYPTAHRAEVSRHRREQEKAEQ
jgi:hypothetical protein